MQQRRIEDPGADAAEAAAERAAEVEHAEVQARGRLDANDAIGHPRPAVAAIARELVLDVVGEERHRLLLARARGLVDDHLQSRDVRANLRRRR